MRESEKTILQTLMSAPNQQLRWSDLLQKTELSKRTLSLSLKDLQRKGSVKRFVDSHAKEYPPPVYYKLAIEALHMEHAQRSLFSVLSMYLFNEILEGASTGRLRDEEFTRLFTERIGALAMYTLLEGLSMAVKDPKEAGKWIEEAFGTLIQKNGWRICLNRQIFRKRIPLKRPITLKEPAVPEITVEEGVIYVKLPSAIEPGLTMRVLKEMPQIREDRLRELKNSLKKLYPEETKILDNALYRVREAARVSRKEEVKI